MQEHPGRGPEERQDPGIAFIETRMRESLRRLGAPPGRARPVDHGDRHLVCDADPILPAMKLAEIIGSHQPDEANARAARFQKIDRVGGEARADISFEARDVDAGMTSDRPGGCDTLLLAWQAMNVLERIAGRDQPPDAVEPQPFQGNLREKKVPLMRRIERAAEQSDPHAAHGFWQLHRAGR